MFLAPQEQVHSPATVASGFFAPHSEQNFPVFFAPHEQVHAPAACCAAAFAASASRRLASSSICRALLWDAAAIKPPPAFMPTPIPINAAVLPAELLPAASKPRAMAPCT